MSETRPPRFHEQFIGFLLDNPENHSDAVQELVERYPIVDDIVVFQVFRTDEYVYVDVERLRQFEQEFRKLGIHGGITVDCVHD